MKKSMQKVTQLYLWLQINEWKIKCSVLLLNYIAVALQQQDPQWLLWHFHLERWEKWITLPYLKKVNLTGFIESFHIQQHINNCSKAILKYWDCIFIPALTLRCTGHWNKHSSASGSKMTCIKIYGCCYLHLVKINIIFINKWWN